MCLLTFMPEYTTASIDDLAVGAKNNPDGFGFAVHAGSSIIHKSGLVFERIAEEFLAVRAKHSGPALFHSRITTHGGTTVENCHPFQVGSDTQTVVAHNGMLPIDAKNGRSDTRIFAESLFPSWGGPSTLNSKKMRKKLAKFAAGSKLVFLSANSDVQNDYTIINEKDGSWDADGVWWSNTSYKYSRYSYSGSGMYTSGWEKSDYGAYLPSHTRQEPVAPTHETSTNVIDYSYTEADGTQVWQEMWVCAICGYCHMFDESNIDMADLCPQCDACWFCDEERMLCACYPQQSELLYKSDLDYGMTNGARHYELSHSVRNYDSAIDNHF